MKSLLVVFLACSIYCGAQKQDIRILNGLDPVISRFAVTGQPALETLLELSRNENLSFGIIVDGSGLCNSRITYDGSNVPLTVLLNSVVTQIPGYKWQQTNPKIIMVGPLSPRPVTEHFLGLTDRQYGPINANIQTLGTVLWVHIRSILHPDQGTAGDILSSTNDRVFAIDEQNASIKHILNRIAIASKGTWVLK